ncbi:MAG: hypothetical protein IT256_05915 [Chitinophagaceae bacterium]|nr:hypothetical protein [Chitinophagaceae bacterium]
MFKISYLALSLRVGDPFFHILGFPYLWAASLAQILKLSAVVVRVYVLVAAFLPNLINDERCNL